MMMTWQKFTTTGKTATNKCLNNNKKGEDLSSVKLLLFHLHKTHLLREFASKNALLYFLFGYVII